MNETQVKSLLSPTSLKIGIIGIGNAGGQVAVAASKSGYEFIILNTSTLDLDNRVIEDDAHAIRIGDGRGSGKNRENAMSLLKLDGNKSVLEIFNNPYFKEVVESSDIVVVTFSTGGGTGSGTGPYMADAIHKAYQNKLVIPYGILPKNNESLMAQSNSIACVDDIAKLKLPYMLADLEYYADLPMELAYKNIAEYVAKTINVIRGDYLTFSTAGMADERDMMTVISEPGYLAVHFCEGLTEAKLTNKTIQGHLIDTVKASPACRIQRDSLLVYNMLITNCNAAISDPIKTGDYSELNAYIGEPKATFASYTVDDARSDVDVISVMSGLTIPMDRFAAPKAKIAANKEKLEKQSALNLGETRKAVEIGGNAATNGVIMGSQKSTGPDLSFLED